MLGKSSTTELYLRPYKFAKGTHSVKIVSRVLKTVAIVMHRKGEAAFARCLLEKNEERDGKAHVRTAG